MDKYPLEPFIHLVAVHNQKPENPFELTMVLWSLDLPQSMVARAFRDEQKLK